METIKDYQLSKFEVSRSYEHGTHVNLYLANEGLILKNEEGDEFELQHPGPDYSYLVKVSKDGKSIINDLVKLELRCGSVRKTVSLKTMMWHPDFAEGIKLAVEQLLIDEDDGPFNLDEFFNKLEAGEIVSELEAMNAERYFDSAIDVALADGDRERFLALTDKRAMLL